MQEYSQKPDVKARRKARREYKKQVWNRLSDSEQQKELFRYAKELLQNR